VDSIKPVLAWLASAPGRVVAAALLFAAVAAIERAPVAKAWLDGRPLAKRIVAVVLAMVGAVATALYAGVSWADAGQAALVAFLGATGANELLTHSLKSKAIP